ncbi:MAG TPA: rhodanese-like domain-containing protein [Pyrinomonadaceae bacterium]|nr:rhodanese-like domain-containing protein [Pyrinomonadaceae bacterium]
MELKRLAVCTLILAATLALARVATFEAFPSVATGQSNSPQIQFVTAEELKTNIANNAPVTIIDVRGSSTLAENDNKIRGAIYVKLRRLKSRLGLPPLKDLPRNREVVTYCACPNDESSIRAAQVLTESGFTRVRVLKGGWVNWKKSKGQVEPLAHVL